MCICIKVTELSQQFRETIKTKRTFAREFQFHGFSYFIIVKALQFASYYRTFTIYLCYNVSWYCELNFDPQNPICPIEADMKLRQSTLCLID